MCVAVVHITSLPSALHFTLLEGGTIRYQPTKTSVAAWRSFIGLRIFAIRLFSRRKFAEQARETSRAQQG